MEFNILSLIYLLASVTFIVGLKMLSHPTTARKGNAVAAAGMALAIVGTIFLYNEEGETLGNYGWIFAGLAIGSVIGTLAARRVKMTAMPEMVSLFNGMGGACAALISIVEFDHLVHMLDGPGVLMLMLRFAASCSTRMWWFTMNWPSCHSFSTTPLASGRRMSPASPT